MFIFIRDDSFIFSVSIILILIQLFVIFNTRMPSEYYCPRCQSENVIIYDDLIECKDCGGLFSREILESGINDESVLAEQELKGIYDSFDEFKDEETQRRFLKSLDEDLKDLEE